MSHFCLVNAVNSIIFTHLVRSKRKILKTWPAPKHFDNFDNFDKALKTPQSLEFLCGFRVVWILVRMEGLGKGEAAKLAVGRRQLEAPHKTLLVKCPADLGLRGLKLDGKWTPSKSCNNAWVHLRRNAKQIVELTMSHLSCGSWWPALSLTQFA